MTEFDTAAEIDIVLNGPRVTARIPLAGEITPDWAGRYDDLAHSRNVPARAESHPGRGWLLVDVPGYTGAGEVAATMDAARDLVSEADATSGADDSAELAVALRDWWKQQRG